MFIKGNLRADTRTVFVRTIKYSVLSEAKEVNSVHGTAISVDVSPGGIGIITGNSLKTGHVLSFENGFSAANGIKAESAIVRWSAKINGNKYRAGLKFL